MSTFYEPDCPNCKSTTMLARIRLGSFGLNIRTFECPTCDYVRVFEPADDPMKFRETTGWLQSELRAAKVRATSSARLKETAPIRGVIGAVYLEQF
jgi:hypothetical protein